MSRRIVTTWPSYLLKRVPAHLYDALNTDAAEQDVSVNDVIRRLLCGRYSLRCPPASLHYRPGRGAANGAVLIRLQPKLARSLGAEMTRTKRTKREIILETLEGHYNGKDQS